MAGGTSKSAANPALNTMLMIPVPDVPKLFKWFMKLVNDANEPVVGFELVGQASTPLILYTVPPTKGASALVVFWVN